MANTHKDNNEIPLRASEVLPVFRKDFSCSERYLVVVLMRVRQLVARF